MEIRKVIIKYCFQIEFLENFDIIKKIGKGKYAKVNIDIF